jgi:hypothetical protein
MLAFALAAWLSAVDLWRSRFGRPRHRLALAFADEIELVEAARRQALSDHDGRSARRIRQGSLGPQ